MISSCKEGPGGDAEV